MWHAEQCNETRRRIAKAHEGRGGEGGGEGGSGGDGGGLGGILHDQPGCAEPEGSRSSGISCGSKMPGSFWEAMSTARQYAPGLGEPRAACAEMRTAAR